MNKTEEIIKVAIEGGYQNGIKWKLQRANSEYSIWVNDTGELTTNYVKFCFLDPKFFQAIGKAKGWDENELTDHEKYIEFGECDVPHWHQVWKYHALRFYEINLSDPIKGWDDAINYLYELIK